MELATQSEFDEVLNRHHNIQYVDAIFTDLCGYVRGKRFPLLEADKIFSDGVLSVSYTHLTLPTIYSV